VFGHPRAEKFFLEIQADIFCLVVLLVLVLVLVLNGLDGSAADAGVGGTGR